MQVWQHGRDLLSRGSIAPGAAYLKGFEQIHCVDQPRGPPWPYEMDLDSSCTAVSKLLIEESTAMLEPLSQANGSDLTVSWPAKQLYEPLLHVCDRL